jgi:hypothetical protein
MIKMLAAAALLSGQPVAAPIASPQPPCVTRQQVGDAVIVVLPILIGTMRERCRAHLPAAAFLNGGADDMAARLRATAEPRRDSALRALGHSTVIGGIRARTGEEGLARLTALITAGFTGVGAQACADADILFESLAPLPPENIARFVGAMVGLASSRAPVGTICPR